MKKRKLISLVAICLSLALLISMITVVSFAGSDDPRVVYDHAAREFRFRNVEKKAYHTSDTAAAGDFGSGRAYPNLFENFENLMPGDSVTQTIYVGAKGLQGGTVEIVLSADRANDSDGDGYGDISSAEQEAFRTLLQSGMLSLTVAWPKSGRSYTTNDLLTGISLGKFNANKTLELNVTLTLSTQADNSLSGLQAGIGWVFTARCYQGPIGDIEGSGGIGGIGGNADHYAYIVGFPDGLVHPERSITRAEVASIFFRVLPDELREQYWSTTNPYTDVVITDWFNNAVSTLTNAGILFGRPGDVFAPRDNITRAEFAALAVRFFGSNGAEPLDEDYFTDLANHWARDEINLACAVGLVAGLPDGTFRPDREITRAEAMAIVNRALKRAPHQDHLLEDMITWPDNMDTDQWYYEDVQEATNGHTYIMAQDKNRQNYEIWKTLLPVRDWAALESRWAANWAAAQSGEVISSVDHYLYR